MSDAEKPPQFYYIRDARQDCGNCVFWWCPKGAGYTCELDKAGKYTEAEAFGKRYTDIPVPCEVAEAAAIRHVRSDVPEMYPYAHRPQLKSRRGRS